MAGRVAGKVAIVTGGASGMGRAGAALLAREGASVVVADISADRAEGVANGIRESGGDAKAMTVDVRDAAQVEAMVGQTVSTYGRVDVLYRTPGRDLGPHDRIGADRNVPLREARRPADGRSEIRVDHIERHRRCTHRLRRPRFLYGCEGRRRGPHPIAGRRVGARRRTSQLYLSGIRGHRAAARLHRQGPKVFDKLGRVSVRLGANQPSVFLAGDGGLVGIA